MSAIARACRDGRVPAEIVVVISDRPEAAGLASAREFGLETQIVAGSGHSDRAAFEARLAASIDAARPDLVVLAGFMRILSASFVARYAGRMINIHPSLLPAHRGLHTHKRVLEAADAVHGASVHFVTAELDSGPVVRQSRVPVRADDTEASLAARVLATEHVIYPEVIGWIATGRLEWKEGVLELDGRTLTSPVAEP